MDQDRGEMMDRQSAQEALQAADTASAAANDRIRPGAPVYLLLGLAETLLLGLVGGPFFGGQQGGTAVVLILALLPQGAAVVYSASRSTTPRYSRAVNAVLLALAAGLMALTLTVGRAVFPDSYAWWIGGALLSGLAIALCGMLKLWPRPTRARTRR
jgi:hypothetical protein